MFCSHVNFEQFLSDESFRALVTLPDLALEGALVNVVVVHLDRGLGGPGLGAV